ncbi:MAG: LytR family transcriptional regulator [Micromonosporaceae bacterium]|nr:LytR family transcriptional regulator [Micromonosporaceae bacterium]
MSFARVRALAIVAVLLIGALVAVYLAMNREPGSAQAGDGACRPGSVPANLDLPAANTVKINVYNATGQVGLASQVGEDFANRNFDLQQRGDDPLGSEVEGVAVLRYGPATVGAAHVLQAYFLNDAEPQFDIERTDDVVDVVIGVQFRQLATETEVRQSIAALGNPEPPPGTCSG